jgi:hypothetical protein
VIDVTQDIDVATWSAAAVPHLLNALHDYFDAQVKEHGKAALPEHEQHHASPAEQLALSSK